MIVYVLPFTHDMGVVVLGIAIVEVVGDLAEVVVLAAVSVVRIIVHPFLKEQLYKLALTCTQ